MRRLLAGFIVFFLIAILILSCKKESETFQTEAISDYYPLVKGKYIDYRLDSTVFTNFGKNTEIHSYRVRHIVDTLLTDNLGRPAYRIYRYIRDSAGVQPWTPMGSYFITPLYDQIEVIEDNLRIIKLHAAIRDGNDWKGNRYLPYNPYDTINGYDDGMTDWEFFYDGDPLPAVQIMGKTYTDVLTVQEDDEAYNFPITDPRNYVLRNYSVEKYSKNIGLIYRELILWEQQPRFIPPNSYDPYKIGFAIKMWMIGHN
jgi:hypothetical protein